MKSYDELVSLYESLKEKLKTASAEEREEIELDLGEIEDDIKRATCNIGMVVEDNYS